MSKFTFVPLIALMIGCGVSEDKFSEKFADKYCNEWTSCGAEEDWGECPVGAGDVLTSNCEFDAKAAKDCLKGSWTCDDVFPEQPSVCEDVCGEQPEEDEE